MSKSNSPLGKHLKSVATYLTRWVRSKPKMEEEKVSEVIEETGVSVEKKVMHKKQHLPPVAVRVKHVPVAKKPIIIPDLSAVAVAKEEPELSISTLIPHSPSSPATGILTAFPEHKNLVGQSVDMKIGSKTHNLIIRTDSLFLDAQKYIVSASGGALGADVELDILECIRTGNIISLKAGAFGKDATMTWNEAEWMDVIDMLLRGKTCKCKTDRGQTLEIKRNNY